MTRNKRWILFYSVAMATISAVALLEDLQHPTHAGTLAWQVTGNVLHGQLNGEFQGRMNPLQSTALVPADVLLCHNKGGAYGYWTHAVIYVGDGQVVDAYSFSNGTTLRPVSNYRRYDTVAVYRAKVSEAQRQSLVKAAKSEVGKPYDPFSPIDDARTEYCSKLVWRCFASLGIILCKPDVWVVPDDIAASDRLDRVMTWSGE